jgi:hypothetical protein
VGVPRRGTALLLTLTDAAIDEVAELLVGLFRAREAPPPPAARGPWCSPPAAAVFLHEAVAHALEADVLAAGGDPRAAIGLQLAGRCSTCSTTPPRRPKGCAGPATTRVGGRPPLAAARWQVQEPLADAHWAAAFDVLSPGAGRRSGPPRVARPALDPPRAPAGDTAEADLYAAAEGGLLLPTPGRGSLDPRTGSFRLAFPFGHRLRGGGGRAGRPLRLSGTVADLLAASPQSVTTPPRRRRLVRQGRAEAAGVGDGSTPPRRGRGDAVSGGVAAVRTRSRPARPPSRPPSDVLPASAAPGSRRRRCTSSGVARGGSSTARGCAPRPSTRSAAGRCAPRHRRASLFAPGTGAAPVRGALAAAGRPPAAPSRAGRRRSPGAVERALRARVAAGRRGRGRPPARGDRRGADPRAADGAARPRGARRRLQRIHGSPARGASKPDWRSRLALLHLEAVSVGSLLGAVARGYYFLDVLGSGRFDFEEDRFTLPVAGFSVQQGRALAPVAGVELTGAISTLLRNLQAVGRDLQFAPLGGMIGAPTVLVTGLEVRGVGG